MHSRTTFVLAGVLAAWLLVAGCSSSSDGQHLPSPSSDPAMSSAPSPPTAPNVAIPLDDSKLRNGQCDGLLTPAQLQSFGFTSAARVQKDTLNGGCEWNDNSIGTGAPANVYVSPQEDLKNGLGDIYKQQHTMVYWKEIQIDGYPADLASHNDERSDGTCTMDLGVSNTFAYLISYDNHDAGEASCDKVQAVGVAVVQALKEGS